MTFYFTYNFIKYIAFLKRISFNLILLLLAPASGASLLAAAAAVASGGSSPSREVQEILSLKDSDLNEFYDESSDTGDDLGDESVGSKKNINEQYNFNETSCKSLAFIIDLKILLIFFTIS